MVPINLNLLEQQGWVCLETGETGLANLEAIVEKAAKAMGTPIRGRSNNLVEHLLPTAPAAAHQHSLSKQYGLDPLPFHVDTSHRPIPCRYVILACANKGTIDVATLLIDRHKIPFSINIFQKMRSALFYIRNGRYSFYSTLIGRENNFLRFDPGCMEPLCHDGDELLNAYSKNAIGHLAIKIRWNEGTLLIFDNWRMLHSRESAQECPSRLLLRCMTI